MEGPQWLQGMLGSSVDLPGPVARDQGRQQWWAESEVCTHMASGSSFRVQLQVPAEWEGEAADTHIIARAGTSRKGWCQLQIDKQLQGP